MIELRQDPQGVRRASKGISVGKEKMKFKNDLTSLDDKLRIANKVNDKYLGLEQEKVESLKELCFEFGVQSEEILANYSHHILATDKGMSGITSPPENTFFEISGA